jgi:hypothetical protein
LDLALLVHAQHQRMFGRIQVPTDDVFQFLGERGIVADIKRSHAMRLQPVRRMLASLMTAAILRVLQCVALLGCGRMVKVTTRCVRRALIVGLRPGRGASFSNPATPSARKRSH